MLWRMVQFFKWFQWKQDPVRKRGLVKVKVLHVYDGDTIRVQLPNGKEERVRFLLIDTPELHHPEKGMQPYGEEAKLYTKYKIYKSRVVELGFDQEERDRYGRLLAYVYCDRKLLQEELVRKGFARVCYTRNRNEAIVNRVRAAQKEAKENKRGIWACKGYVSRNGYHPEAMGLFQRFLHMFRGKLLKLVLD
ncbi:thermonuclease family protein [Thermoflavimicrobium dichotomicum]|uniref:Micrococcal nuclease n=1 Tax=Thermoflavimicrobium dichotomicum TaxID=46223 RepID=A0A1I3TEZ5_9BACL|nr:thermonuclease family protein [Thermoflavimicrobium dichotomicum]SFJ69072.1 micrococcal nuclease [Thermoflavimicrobium dichotomicum]